MIGNIQLSEHKRPLIQTDASTTWHQSQSDRKCLALLLGSLIVAEDEGEDKRG